MVIIPLRSSGSADPDISAGTADGTEVGGAGKQKKDGVPASLLVYILRTRCPFDGRGRFAGRGPMEREQSGMRWV